MKKITNSTKHYHEQVTYDSKKENWSALFSILLIPAFLFLVGFGVTFTFKLPVRDDVNGTGSTGIQRGIGGGEGITLTPSPTLSPSQSLEPTDEVLQIIQ